MGLLLLGGGSGSRADSYKRKMGTGPGVKAGPHAGSHDEVKIPALPMRTLFYKINSFIRETCNFQP